MTHIKIFILSILSIFILVTGIVGVIAYKHYTRPKPKIVIEPPKERTIRLLEGWTIGDMEKYFEKENVTKSEDFEKALTEINRSEYPVLSTIPTKESLEGFLFPDTYSIFEEATPKEIIEKLLATFQKKINSISPDSTKQIYEIPNYEELTVNEKPDMSLYQIITLASIVEKETGIDLSKLGSNQQDRLLEERRTVAGIFLNRLLVGKALESDATVNYATGKQNASSEYKDLENNSPYNTYKFNGLPPGPICNPSLMSIEAVMNPIETDYFYFLHKQPSGEVVYSKTFEEHVNNKFKYLK